MGNSISTQVKAVILRIENIKGGVTRFAVTRPADTALFQEGSTVTFTLSAWDGKHEPLKGQVVMLSDIEKFERGWRARKAVPITLASNKE